MRKTIIAAAAALAISAVAFCSAFVRTMAPQVHFATLDGKKIATWCASCVKEMHRKYVVRRYETVAVALRSDPPRRPHLPSSVRCRSRWRNASAAWA